MANSPSARSGRPPSLAKRNDVLRAATHLFARQGVAQTSTRQIAAQADTTERTLFKHFGSKDGLVNAVIEEAVIAHLAPASLAQLQQAIQTPRDDLRGWHGALLAQRSQALGESPELTRLLLIELLRDPLLRERFASEWLPKVWQPLVAALRQLQQERRTRADISPESQARMFLSLNLGYLIARHVLAPEARWSEAADIDDITALFACGVGSTST